MNVFANNASARATGLTQHRTRAYAKMAYFFPPLTVAIVSINYGDTKQDSMRHEIELKQVPQIHQPLEGASNDLTITDTESQYVDRITDLREMAPDEGLRLDEGSLSQFLTFLKKAPFDIRRAAVGLGLNGEINAVWVSEDGGERLSIEFYANERIRYAWLPASGIVEIDEVSRQEFWTKFEEILHGFLSSNERT